MDPINIPQMLALPAPWILWDCCFFKCFFADVDFSLQTTQLWLFAANNQSSMALATTWGYNRKPAAEPPQVSMDEDQSSCFLCSCSFLISKNPRGTLRKTAQPNGSVRKNGVPKKSRVYHGLSSFQKIEIPYVGVESTMCVGTPKQLLLYIISYI